MQFAEVLQNLMKSQGISNYRLAKTVGCSQSTVKYWLEGRTMPQNRTLIAVAEALGVTPAFLRGDEDERGFTGEDWALMGQMFKSERELRGKSLEDCADGEIITAADVAAFEDGLYKPTPAQIVVISGALGLSPDYIFFGNAEKLVGKSAPAPTENERPLGYRRIARGGKGMDAADWDRAWEILRLTFPGEFDD